MPNSCTSYAEICYRPAISPECLEEKGWGLCLCVCSSALTKNFTDRVCAAEAVATATGEPATAKAAQYIVENYMLSLRVRLSNA